MTHRRTSGCWTHPWTRNSGRRQTPAETERDACYNTLLLMLVRSQTDKRTLNVLTWHTHTHREWTWFCLSWTRWVNENGKTALIITFFMVLLEEKVLYRNLKASVRHFIYRNFLGFLSWDRFMDLVLNDFVLIKFYELSSSFK